MLFHPGTIHEDIRTAYMAIVRLFRPRRVSDVQCDVGGRVVCVVLAAFETDCVAVW